MTEPTTLLTDYLLGGLAGVLAWRLVRDQVRLKPDLSVSTARLLWKLTTLSMGVASFFLLASTFTASFRAPVRNWLFAAAAVKLALYVVWMLGHDDFAYDHVRLDKHLGVQDRATEMITEIYVPRPDLPSFMAEVAGTFRKNGGPIVYRTVRLIEKDDESHLQPACRAYRRGDRAFRTSLP